MIPLIVKFFKIWWYPIMVLVISGAIFLTGLLVKQDFVIDISLLGFLIACILIFISCITQLFIKKWYFGLLQVAITVPIIYYLLLLMALSPPDFFAAHLAIPSDIEISNPATSEPSHEEIHSKKLVLTQSFQPGIYNYYVLHSGDNQGTYFIKAYEITSNQVLSESRLKDRSKIYADETYQKVHKNDFTIYEGDWGQEYAARIELWFIPSNGGSEYKIEESNYIVEGWMR